MLNKQGFNLWANDYDQTVQLSEESNHYPFAGYKTILNTIFNEIMQKKQSKVLDIGFGTAVLTSKLYEEGHSIDGLDFSSEMIKIAQAKMPTARLMEWDISKGFPISLKNNKYDFIISTYTLHHLSNEEKISFIRNLLSLLEEDGKIIIGDIAFKTREQLGTCREESNNYWDEDEFYFVEEELHPLLKEFCQCEFHPISHCGGVFIITRR
ncbi:class I SAM-dependent methyltransferase [Rummeliibacillus pycnus]|uniref:class I SAM-dependent methyltransferase n=1 Tax=Rummeliibacillus pycnus TaxID=101070 RepID=UPI0037CA7ABD